MPNEHGASLIKRALSIDPGRMWRPNDTLDITDEEIELYLAYIQGEVTGKQCKQALGRSHGYFINWFRRCALSLFANGRLSINWDNSIVKFKKESYAQREEKQKHWG